jgi:hypothetical protein
LARELAGEEGKGRRQQLNLRSQINMLTRFLAFQRDSLSCRSYIDPRSRRDSEEEEENETESCSKPIGRKANLSNFVDLRRLGCMFDKRPA